MTIFDKIKQRVKNMLGVEKLNENPNSNRYNFISNIDTVRQQHLEEYRIWYLGDSDELLNFYLNREVGGNAKEPIYNRNKKQYFWGLSEKECAIKRVHTGIVRASINTAVNCVGKAEITSSDIAWDGKPIQDKIDKIIEVNKLNEIFTQEARPLTLAEGDGAYKLTFDKDFCETVLIQYYEAGDIDVVIKNGLVVGIIYKDYYEYQGKKYVLLEIRRVEKGNSIVEFELYKLAKSNEVTPVELSCIPELACLPEDGYIIEGVDEILGEVNKYFHDPLNKGRGLSVLAGKIDIADDMDMLASVESLTEKSSGPIEYYPVDLLKRDKKGNPVMPKIFGRTYVQKPTIVGPDGSAEGKIDTSAPQLNFSQYSDALVAKTNLFLLGFLSPASLGNNIAKNDNAEAQREKEKVTYETATKIIDAETCIIKNVIKKALMLQEYMDTGKITITDYEISVKYKAMTNPSFDNMSGILLPMLSQGGISPEEYVSRLYGDSKSDEEKQFEIDYIKGEREKDAFDMEGLLGNGEETSGIIPTTEGQETNAIEPQE